MRTLCCCNGDEDSTQSMNHACLYYGCLPKLAPLNRSTDALPRALGSSVPNTLTSPELPREYSHPRRLPAKPPGTVRVVIISDTHERHREMHVPPGDLLVHGGDIQEGIAFWRARDKNLKDFFSWFNDPILHPHPAKVVIGGNHDSLLAKMKRESVRAMAAPALYLEEESAVLEPIGLRIFGSPRSTANSRLSPNECWQSPAAWKPFRTVSLTAREASMDSRRHQAEEEEDNLLPVGSQTPLLVSPSPMCRENEARQNDPTSAHALTPYSTSQENSGGKAGGSSYSLRLEGDVALGPVDILLTHQTPEYPEKRSPLKTQPIMAYLNAVSPRRIQLGGHLHGSHGFHKLPVPPKVAGAYGYVVEAASGESTVEPLPFFPCINASMMIGSFVNSRLLPASVVDIEI